jgi:hypothetical protein
MHCWHQKVVVQPASESDRYGDVLVDTERSVAVFREWLARSRPAPGPGGLRRPRWLGRPMQPSPETYELGPS